MRNDLLLNVHTLEQARGRRAPGHSRA